ncbi:MAG: hypothetical protein JSR09_02475 [Bacteroidetes bacterium]|nr:hypothetical protein [Bacteroidota bacterium]MBS1648550.1 hypothetical protein [Bacteroidota bacterium]
MNIHSTIKRTIFYTFLATVYLAFFIVQCIYNFDTSNAVVKKHHTQLHTISSSLQHSFSVVKQHHPPKKSIRLNKRFQPETLPANITTVSVPETIFIENYFSSYKEKVYTTIFYSTALRGPPALI